MLPNRTDRAVQMAREKSTIRDAPRLVALPILRPERRTPADLVTFTDLRFGRLVGETTVIVPH